MKQREELVHVKGFSLTNKDVRKKINFLSLSSCVNNREQVIEIRYANKIVRNNKQQIRVENEVKKFSFTFDKRDSRRFHNRSFWLFRGGR